MLIQQQGLNLGLASTILRNGIFNMVYFGVYHSGKRLVEGDDVRFPFPDQ
jgi:hypothetical protein